MGWNDRLDPPEENCCEADDCTEPDEFGNVECRCDDHGCTTCGLEHGCICDDMYEQWKDEQDKWDRED